MSFRRLALGSVVCSMAFVAGCSPSGGGSVESKRNPRFTTNGPRNPGGSGTSISDASDATRGGSDPDSITYTVVGSTRTAAVPWSVATAKFETVDVNRSCAVNLNGQEQCWGLGAGAGVTSPLIPPSGEVEVSLAHSSGPATFQCRILKRLSDGRTRVACYGAAASPVLGPSAGTSVVASTPYSIPVPGDRPVVQLVAGSSHACLRTVDDDVYCWGENAYGQLGVPSTTLSRSAVPILFRTEGARGTIASRGIDLAAAGHLTCVVGKGGEILAGSDMPEISGNLRCFGRVRRGSAWVEGTFSPKLSRLITPNAENWGPPMWVSAFSDVEITPEAGCVIRATDRHVFCWRMFDAVAEGSATVVVARELLNTDVRLSSPLGRALMADRMSISNGLACALEGRAVHCWGVAAAVRGVAGAVESGFTRSFDSRFRPWRVLILPALGTGVTLKNLMLSETTDAGGALVDSADGKRLCLSTSDARIFCYGYSATGVSQASISNRAIEIPLSRVVMSAAPGLVFSAGSFTPIISVGAEISAEQALPAGAAPVPSVIFSPLPIIPDFPRF